MSLLSLSSIDGMQQRICDHTRGACLQIDKMYVVKIGEVALYRGEEKVEDPNFIHEIAGFSYFGETSINAVSKCPYTVKVASESLHFLTLPKR